MKTFHVNQINIITDLYFQLNEMHFPASVLGVLRDSNSDSHQDQADTVR